MRNIIKQLKPNHFIQYIALFEISMAAIGYFIILHWTSNSSTLCHITYNLFAVLCSSPATLLSLLLNTILLISGILLWRRHISGLLLSIFSQGAQMIAFAIGQYTYVYITGLFTMINFPLSERLPENLIDIGLGVNFAFDPVPVPDIFSINLIAVYLTIYLTKELLYQRRLYRLAKNVLLDESNAKSAIIPPKPTTSP